MDPGLQSTRRALASPFRTHGARLVVPPLTALEMESVLGQTSIHIPGQLGAAARCQRPLTLHHEVEGAIPWEIQGLQAGLTQSGKVESNLLPKVFVDVIQWLVLAPLPPAVPVPEKDLALAEAAGSQLLRSDLVGTLREEAGGGQGAGPGCGAGGGVAPWGTVVSCLV